MGPSKLYLYNLLLKLRKWTVDRKTDKILDRMLDYPRQNKYIK